METLMKQTNNELRNIAQAEGLPYSNFCSLFKIGFLQSHIYKYIK